MSSQLPWTSMIVFWPSHPVTSRLEGVFPPPQQSKRVSKSFQICSACTLAARIADQKRSGWDQVYLFLPYLLFCVNLNTWCRTTKAGEMRPILSRLIHPPGFVQHFLRPSQITMTFNQTDWNSSSPPRFCVLVMIFFPLEKWLYWFNHTPSIFAVLPILEECYTLEDPFADPTVAGIFFFLQTF